MSADPALGRLLAILLGPGFAIAHDVPALVDDALFPEERQHIASAVEKRRAEFGMARLCARRALAALGVGPCALVPHADRSPRWPDGVVGSISHTQGCCAVVVAKAADVAGVGLDVEQDEELRPELERMICTPPERAWLDSQPSARRGQLGKLFFSAKEAFYKAQYPLTRAYLDFRDVDLHLDLPGGTFAVARIGRAGPLDERLRAVRGKFGAVPGLIVSTAVLLGATDGAAP
jgi:4'-phosphopantetheinyl transferase EntD